MTEFSPAVMMLLFGILCFGILGTVQLLSNNGNLKGIKSRPTGDGQHGTARFATPQEIARAYKRIPFTPALWRQGKNLPNQQGLLVGSQIHGRKTTALIDDSDVHSLMIGASGVGKTAHFLYPALEYTCATGMSFLCTDTKGDVYRNYGAVAREFYGYRVAVVDLRNPTRSDGANMLHLVSRYMDQALANQDDLRARAKAEKHAKITAKTIIQAGGDSSYGQNAYFYDAAEGLLASTIMLVAEFCPPEKRHIISVFKLMQDLLAPGKTKGKNQFQSLMELLPSEHKAKWMAGAALNTGEQAMLSVISTAMSRLNAFLDSELEQILCFETAVDAETFVKEKSAIFLVMPEEDPTAYFLISLLIQQLYREIMTLADEFGGALPKRVVFYADEFGTLPKLESAEMIFSAARSRRLSIVALIQGLVQLDKNYGKEGAQVIRDNCQLTIFGGFAPGSTAAESLSSDLGEQTVLSGSVSTGKDSSSRSLQMMGRRLMTPDELKSMPKGSFITMRTGMHPMKTTFRLFLDWGIRFEKNYVLPDRAARKVQYADKEEVEQSIREKFGSPVPTPEAPEPAVPSRRRPNPVRID